MASKFGLLEKLDFLQNWASALISSVPPAVAHNLDKYWVLNKVHYLCAVDGTEGDYLEFGVFKGSSFRHSIKCCHKFKKFNPDILKTKFYGFDSFDGFGELDVIDEHTFFQDSNFATTLEATNKRIKKISGEIDFKLIPGFFEESLSCGPKSMGIEKAKIVMIDCDTYSGAKEALNFCKPIVQQGTIFLLDDYFYYKGNKNKGEMRAFEEFIHDSGVEVRELCTYGMGSIVYIVTHIN